MSSPSYMIFKADAAAHLYHISNQCQQVMRGFAIDGFTAVIDDALIRYGVNAWTSHASQLLHEATEKYPGMTSENAAVKSYYKLHHMSTAFMYDPQNHIGCLTYNVYGTGTYFGFEIPAADMCSVLEIDILTSNEDRRYLIEHREQEITVSGVPRPLALQAVQAAKENARIFQRATDIHLDTQNGLWRNSAFEVAVQAAPMTDHLDQRHLFDKSKDHSTIIASRASTPSRNYPIVKHDN
jgi:hypothetical protein